MADSEESRLKRLKHEERMSRVFDEVMGLGDFADTSRGSVSSSKSGSQTDTKALDETSTQEENQPVDEDSTCSKEEEKMEESVGETAAPPCNSSPAKQHSEFNLRAGEGRGGAAFDDALDGLPTFRLEEDDEDWHFTLPIGSLEDVDVGKASAKENQPEKEKQTSEDETMSANTSNSSQDHSPENSRDDGTLNQTETEDSQQEETPVKSRVRPASPQTPPIANIKDEPIDDGYDAALLPQNSLKQIKEEMDHQEEELRISSVYSVGGNTFSAPPLPPVVSAPAVLPPAVTAPTQTAFFIPGRGAVLQAMTSLAIRPAGSLQGSIPTLTAIQPRPPPPPVPGSVRCSGCSKVLLKGQTAFQRKGSTQLFCSTVCLTGHLPPVKNRHCIQCSREILQPRDTVTIPDENNTLLYFCGQFCLSVYRHKKKLVEKVPDKPLAKLPEKMPEKPPEKPAERQADKLICSVCRAAGTQMEHEVTHQGRLHTLCSDACFVTWRRLRQLAMNCCEGCGLYCSSNSSSCQTLYIDKTPLNFCSPTCIGTYKQSSIKTTECPNCHKICMVSSAIMERDHKGKVKLYCSSVCVEKSRPPHHNLTGTPFPCSLCKVFAVPQYHLALVDGTIRNFCSYSCVCTYRKSESPAQPELYNGNASVKDPVKPGASAGASSVPPVPQDFPSSAPLQSHLPSQSSMAPLKLPQHAVSSPTVPLQSQAKSPTAGGAAKMGCYHCRKELSIKPLVFSHQGRVSLFCTKTCLDLHKKQKNLLALCEQCKQEKLHYETIVYNQQDMFFCSENCKTLFKHEMTSSHKDHSWFPCTYCSGFAPKMLCSHYGGKMEEFCKPHCMSQYTVLYYGMSRCDSCRKQGYMNEKLECLGSVRNFCNLACLHQYCSLNSDWYQSASSNGDAPLAPTQPYVSEKMNPAIAGVVSLANGAAAQPAVSADGTLTGALPTSNTGGKNLDHASTQTDAMRLPLPRRRQMKNKSVLCRPMTVNQETMFEPLPPPVVVSSDQEKVKVLLVPVPVPVFIPVPMNMYSQHTPVPMAMPMPLPVPIVIPPEKKHMKDAFVQSEQITADLSSSPDTTSAIVPEICDKAIQTETPKSDDDKPETKSESSATAGVSEPPSSPMTDLESDFPVESLDQTAFVPKQGLKRARESSTGRKRGRRRVVLSDNLSVVPPSSSSLQMTYGLKAWRSWVHQHNKQQQQQQHVEEEVLRCSSAELNFALCRFIKEVRRPNGENYTADSVFYLCLGIQQYLFLMGRTENIFMDETYKQFAAELSQMLQLWKPKLLPKGGIVPSRVEESYLWECKQLGAYSPIVLLNTLLYFCTKNFRWKTLEEHRRVSFLSLTRRRKPSKNKFYLQYQQLAAEADEGCLEMLEDTDNPLRCPVKLYEFYLSRCPDDVENRSDVFYLQPARDIHTHSSHWFTTQPLDLTVLQNMLARLLAVREVQLELETPSAPCSTEVPSSSTQ